MKLEFSRQFFSKKFQISNSVKIRPVGAVLFHAEEQADRHDEANSHYSHFCERT